MLGRYRRAGKHRSTGASRARPILIDVVNARTLATHLLTPDALEVGRSPEGRYVAACGADVIPAAMVEPGRGYCLSCVSIPSQRSRWSKPLDPDQVYPECRSR